jgi:MFS superfamily sulfate permease-like transporter
MAVGLFAAGALLLPLQEFPRSILGAMLVFAGLELSLPARDTGTREDFLVCLLTAGLILAVNVTLGFLAGVILWAIFRRRNNTPGRKCGING